LLSLLGTICPRGKEQLKGHLSHWIHDET